LSFGDSLGDNLLLTTLAKGLYHQGHKNIWVKCDHAFLFQNNPHVKLLLPFNALLSTHLLRLFKVKMINPAYTEYDEKTDRDLIPEKHIILKMADLVGLKGSIANKPDLYLNQSEEQNQALPIKQIAIVTSTRGAKFPMRNKEWLIERYQQIVDKFYSDYKFIQLGTENDFPLKNVCDLRGKTSVRDSASILKNSILMISHVGFMMHLARSVDCRAVIIYGGREKPEQSGYSCFENIYSDMECSPCWLHNKCDFNNKCMTVISAKMVELAVSNQLKLIGKPLTVDLLYND
jgi:ADP-heptose:LPS heptosyltransferase